MAKGIIRTGDKMQGTEFGMETIIYCICTIQSENQTLGNMWQKGVLYKPSVCLINRNELVRVNTMPQRNMRVNCVNMKHTL